jgi:pimeloyl-ACP methyl ester carboxylesterase
LLLTLSSLKRQLTNPQNGYPTIAIDNLGSGNSSHPDPVAVVQMALQAEIAHKIITMLRSGQVQGPVNGKKFSKVIVSFCPQVRLAGSRSQVTQYVGHSYGSIQGNAIAATFPNDVDTFVLTGYTGRFIEGLVPLASGLAVPAQAVMPRFANLPVGYLAQSYEPGRVYGLYTVNGVGGFDPNIAQYDFDNEGTVAPGELATLFYGVTPAKQFTGSVFVVTGQQDAIVCNNAVGGADCLSPTNKVAEAKGFFPAAKDYSYIIPGKTGHSANLHYSSPDSFKKIHSYLAGQGY